MKADYYRNKHLLGELTLGDLLRAVKVEGDFSLGRNWLPICRVRILKKRRVAEFFMDSTENEASLCVPLENRVKVVDCMVSTKGSDYLGEVREVRIRLDSPPDFLL